MSADLHRCSYACIADLVDPPAGRHVVALAVDDALQQPHWRQRLKMPRADLAALAVQCLLLKDAGGLGNVNAAAELHCCSPLCDYYCKHPRPWALPRGVDAVKFEDRATSDGYVM